MNRLVALLVICTMAACDSSNILQVSQPSTFDTPPPLVIGPSPITFNTYDGSGEIVHPDMVTFSTPWHGYRIWSAVTPYPNSAIRFENPSLFGSNDGNRWEIPLGVRNPLATTQRGYLSDPDILYEPTYDELWMYYREVENASINGKMVHITDHVWLTTSQDGVVWTSPRRIISDKNRFVVSPSVVRVDEGTWLMYQVDAGAEGCSAKSSKIQVRTSNNGINWSSELPLNFIQPGFIPWHIDVQYVQARGEYWMLAAAYESGRGCMTTSLFLATSPDGVTWKTFPSPVLAAGDIPQFASAVYRSTFSYESDDQVTIWYSGGSSISTTGKKPSKVFRWSAAVTHTTVHSIFTKINDRSKSVRLTVVTTENNPRLITIAP